MRNSAESGSNGVELAAGVAFVLEVMTGRWVPGMDQRGPKPHQFPLA